MKKRVIPSILSLILILAALSGCSKQQAGGGFSMPPMPVETALVASATVEDRFDAVGTIEAHDAVTIVAEIDAIVVDLPFTEGAAIEKGTLIAQLDDTQLRAERERALAIRDQRKAAYDRIKSLLDKAVTSQQEFDDVNAAYKVAEAELAMIEAKLAKTRIVAPFSGEVGARKVSPGAFLRAGTPITDLANITELKVTFSAPERYFPLLRRGSEVSIATAPYPDYELKGRIEVIEPTIDLSTRAAKMIAHFANPGGRFRPGMSANISAVLARRENALLVPDEAIFAEGAQSLVFVVNPDSTVARKPVTVGARQRKSVEIVQGLEPGMTVVKAGHQKLFEGAKVMPIMAPSNIGETASLNGGTK